MKSAEIITFNEFDKLVFEDDIGRRNVVCTSGGYDPIHPGHISCIMESSKLADVLVVIVNGDNFLRTKKGARFQNLQTRCKIVAGIRGVDYVIPFEIENDQTVIEALKRIKPNIFTKGGDRVDEKTIPEWKICQELGIKIVTGIGDPKEWSSSDFLKEWGEWYYDKRMESHWCDDGHGYW